MENSSLWIRVLRGAIVLGSLAFIQCNNDSPEEDLESSSDTLRGGKGTKGGGGGGGTVTSAPSTCSLMLPGATGAEPGQLIPACCTPSSGDKSEIDEVFRLLNSYRQSNGLSELTYDPNLEAAVQGHCEHMSQHTFFAHFAPEAAVSDPGARANLCNGGSWSGENLALGPSTAREAMDSWKASSGHNANMLAPDHKRVGICSRGGYWGQLFGY